MRKEDVYQLLDSLSRIDVNDCFTYRVGNFKLNIAVRNGNQIIEGIDKINNYYYVYAYLYEKTRDDDRAEYFNYDKYVNLAKDQRFKNYLPIKNSIICNGDKMPIDNLVELILYLNRISTLKVFE